MVGCCHDDHCQVGALQGRQRTMLQVALAINIGMFVVEFAGGWLASSTGLLGDSMDMLGDALVYAVSLFVIARSVRWKAASAGLNGGIMAVFAVTVLVQAGSEALYGNPPLPALMAIIAALALLANTSCFVLLTRHRGDDVNMRAAWLCSRNDLIANAAVLVAAAAVALTHTPWPDIAVGAAIAALFLRSSIGVLGDALRDYKSERPKRSASAEH